MLILSSGKREPYSSTLHAIRAALESAGVIFVEENGEGPGVRLRKAKPPVNDHTELPHSPDVYVVGRLESKHNCHVAEDPIFASDDADAMTKLGDFIRSRVVVGSDYSLNDIIMIKRPDETILANKTIADLIGKGG